MLIVAVMRGQAKIVSELIIAAIGLLLVAVLWYTQFGVLYKTERTSQGTVSLSRTNLILLTSLVGTEGNHQKVCLIVKTTSGTIETNNLVFYLGNQPFSFSSSCKRISNGSPCRICILSNLPAGSYTVKLTYPGGYLSERVTLPPVPVPPNISLKVSSPAPTKSNGTNFDYYFVNEGTAVTYLIEANDDEPGFTVDFDCEGDGTYELEDVSADKVYTKTYTCNYGTYSSFRPTLVVKDLSGLVSEENFSIALFSLKYSAQLAFYGGVKRYLDDLFYGDYNDFTVTIYGPYGTYTVEGNCFDTASRSYTPSSLIPFQIADTTNTYGFNCSLNVDYNSETFYTWLIKVWRYYKCSSATECASDISNGVDTKPALITLQTDLSDTITLGEKDYSNVIFDANDHNAAFELNVAGSTTYLTLAALKRPSKLLVEAPEQVCCLLVEPGDCITLPSFLIKYSEVNSFRVIEYPVKETFYCTVSSDVGNPDVSLSFDLTEANSQLYTIGSPDYYLEDNVGLKLYCNGTGSFYLETNTHDVSTSGAELNNYCSYVYEVPP